MADGLDRARTPLLTLITQEAVDRDYQAAAARREAAAPAARAGGDALPDQGEGGRRTSRSRYAVVAVVAAFAMLVTVAAVQTSQNADVNDASRASLIERIETRRDTVGDMQRQIAAMREANTTAEDALRSLGRRYADVQSQRTRLRVLTGFERVSGPGVRITLDNPDLAGDTEVLRDSDLALLADALWAAGAEAIAINGQRLTAVSAIRNSGTPIEVNSIGIAPPYTIEAIGERGALAANVVETGSGLQFLALVDQYDFSYDVDNVDELRLPAAPVSLERLRSATYQQSAPKGGGGDAP